MTTTTTTNVICRAAGWIVPMLLMGLPVSSVSAQPAVFPDGVLDMWKPDAVGCPDFKCGLNSATVGDGVVFDALDWRGKVGDPAVWLVRAEIEQGGTRELAQIRVEGDRLVVEGHSLISLAEERTGRRRALVLTIANRSEEVYELRLLQVRLAAFWVGPAGGLDAYKFHVKLISRRPGSPILEAASGASLCGLPYKRIRMFEGVEQWALAFAGDHYDNARKTVWPAGSTSFNLACQGTAMAKMHLMRHTTAGRYVSQGLEQVTSWEQRQALLKMLVADYCGDGRAFTDGPRPLRWALANGSYPTERVAQPVDLSSRRRVEAIWGPEGAICLNTPRVAKRTDVLEHCLTTGKAVPTAKLKAYMPGCSEIDWQDRGTVVSVHAGEVPPPEPWPALLNQLR